MLKKTIKAWLMIENCYLIEVKSKRERISKANKFMSICFLEVRVLMCVRVRDECTCVGITPQTIIIIKPIPELSADAEKTEKSDFFHARVDLRSFCCHWTRTNPTSAASTETLFKHNNWRNAITQSRSLFFC